MKIIFLDIDGVMCTPESFRLPRRVHDCYPGCSLQQPSPVCVSALNKIIAETEAKIVVSSTWRLMGAGKIARVLRDWGVTAEVCGVTPNMGCLARRGNEIEAWLSKNGDVEQFVILDDDCDMCHLKDMHIWTNPDTGLTMDDAKRAIEILSGVQYERAV